MPAQINLLPKEFTHSKEVAKVASVLNKLAVSVAVVFFGIVIVGGGVFFILSSRLSSMQDESEALLASVQNLQSTEAGLILLKDRLQKSQNVLSMRTSEKILDKQKNILLGAPPDIFFKSADIDAGRSVITITALNSRTLVGLLSSVLARDDISSLTMLELSFSPFRGYEVTFEVF